MTKQSINWKEQFDKGIAIQKNQGDPYWPDWEGVKSFISTEIIAKIIDEIPNEMEDVYWDKPFLTKVKQQLRNKWL